MRKIAYKKLSAEGAKKVLSPADYEIFRKLMQGSPASSFVYTNRFGEKKTYVGVDPIGYFMTPGWTPAEVPGRTYLWAYHSAHGKKESFVVSRISEVEIIPGLIDGIIDPSTFADYWSGEKDWAESI